MFTFEWPKHLPGVVHVTVMFPQRMHSIAAEARDSILAKSRDNLAVLLNNGKGRVIAAALSMIHVIDNVETKINMPIPLMETMVRAPLNAAIRTIDPGANISVSAGAVCKSGSGQASLFGLIENTMSVPKQICTRVLIFINKTPVGGLLSRVFLDSADSAHEDPDLCPLQISPVGSIDGTVAITLHYRGSDKNVPAMIARRVHSHMHYPVDLRPFEAVVHLQQAEEAERLYTSRRDLASPSFNRYTAPPTKPLPQAYTPLSFPPSPKARDRVIATHSSRAENILCGARDKLSGYVGS